MKATILVIIGLLVVLATVLEVAIYAGGIYFVYQFFFNGENTVDFFKAVLLILVASNITFISNK